MPSLTRHDGYLLLDHRVSGGQLVEAATITCAHCHAIVVRNPDRTRARGYCARCDHYLCDGCAVTGACRNFTRLLDTLQNAAVHALGKG